MTPADLMKIDPGQLLQRWAVPPPSIGEFIDSPDYLGLKGQCCDAVRETLTALFDDDSSYTEAALLWGIGAGKSFLTSIANAYIVYRLLCLRDPQAYYGLAAGSTIAVVNFSVTASQAKKVVFGEVAGRIDNAPCFQRPGFRRDPSIQSELRWPDRGVVVFPGNSQATSAIGYNVLAAVVDEASFLPEVEGSVRVAGRSEGHRYDAAEELYNAISKRILSRGNSRWRRHSLFCMISSPRYVGDFLERKAAEAQTASHIYHSRLPTWAGVQKATLSGRTFSDPVCGAVPVEYEEQFIRNPERARRDLGAVASEAIGGYFSNPDLIAAGANPDRGNPLGPDGDLLPGEVPAGQAIVVHVDLGLRRDACGVAGVYYTEDRYVLAFVRRFRPADFAGGEVDFAAVREWVLDLQRRHRLQVACVSYDGWQSVESRQALERAGVPTREVSVDRSTRPYDTLKELMLTGQLDYYHDDALFDELRQLELVKGVKVDHPPGGSKDMADAVAGALYNLLELLAVAEQERIYTIEDLIPGWQPVRLGY